MIKNYPVIKIVLLFVFGILLRKFIAIDSTIVLILIMFPIIALFLFLTIESKEKYISLINGLLFIVICLAGILRLSISEENNQNTINSFRIIPDSAYGIIEAVDLPNKNKIEFIAKIDSVWINKHKFTNGKKFLVKPSSKTKAVHEEDLIIGRKFTLTGRMQSARNKRNPGEFDYRNYLLSNDIQGMVHYTDIKFIEPADNRFQNIIKNIRYKLFAQINTIHSGEHAALISGLLLAYRKNLEYDTIERFVNSGVVHVLAVSGLHVGFITFIFLFLFSRFNIYLKYLLTITGLLLFVLITNVQPSVLRASIMACSVIVGFILSRKNNGFNAISIAALIILSVWPEDLFNPGFQLSFSAVLSIMIFYPLFRDKINLLNINKSIKDIFLFIAVSLSAQIGTLPFTLMYFHKLSVISLIANLIVIPLIGFIVAIGILSIAVSFLSLFIAGLLANTNNLLMWILFETVRILGNPSYSFINIARFTVYDFILFYALLIFVLIILKRMKSMKMKLIFIVLIFLNFNVWEKIDNLNYSQAGKLKIMMVDVGQGDAFLISFPDKKIALIDAGAASKSFDNGKRVLLPLMNYLSINKINYAFVSHIDNDHYGGFKSLLDNIAIEKIYKPVLNPAKKSDVDFERKIKRKKIPIVNYQKSVITGENYRVYILNNNNVAQNNSEGENEKSGIIKIQYGKTSFLFVGDAGFDVEDDLIKTYGQFLQANVLKVGHHGSKHSTSESFLKFVNPKYALISAGEYNTFKHPAPVVIQLLKNHGVEILRTDRSGAVTLSSDGFSIEKESIE